MPANRLALCWFLTIALGLAWLGLAAGPSRAASGASRPEIVPGVVVVGFDGAPAARQFARGRAASLGLRPRRLIAKLGAQTLTVPVGQELAWAERLRREPGVRFAEPDFVIRALRVPNDSLYPDQADTFGPHSAGDGFLGGLDVEDAWNYRTTSGDLIIGILDTGVDYRHPDLAPNMFHRPRRHPQSRDNPADEFADDTLGWNFVDSTNNPSDSFGHGTGVAGLIGAVGNNRLGTTGVLWKTQMLAVKVLGDGGEGSGTSVVEGIVYAVDAGARILNLSLGGYGFGDLGNAACEYAHDHGAIMVCAAGNDALDLGASPIFPGSVDLDNVIAVGAVTRVGEGLTTFSNFGGRMHIAAPGLEILSTFVGGGYHSESGTSFATPLVSGAVAMLWARRPDWNYRQVVAALYASARVRPGSGDSWGVLDFQGIVAQMLGDSLPPAPVGDLSLIPTGGGTAAALFTAPGEDGRGGYAEDYRFRWSDDPISPANFDRATPLEVAHKPGLGGVRDSVPLTGLPVGRTIHIAMKARDRVHNISAVSNDGSVLVPVPARIELSADTLALAAAAGDGVTGRFKIYNRGSEPLHGQLLDFSDTHFTWQTARGSTLFEIAPHDSLQVRLSVDAGDLESGIARSVVGRIVCDDPVRPHVRVLVNLLVTPSSAASDSTRARSRVTPPREPRAGARDSFAAALAGSEDGKPRFALGPAWFESGSPPRILDVTGREVARLARNTGDGPVAWDGVTLSGARAASGIYFLKLEAPGHSRVLRFVRIR